eukprot:15295197-Alexandrium_andersonii.AAC.1
MHCTCSSNFEPAQNNRALHATVFGGIAQIWAPLSGFARSRPAAESARNRLQVQTTVQNRRTLPRAVFGNFR